MPIFNRCLIVSLLLLSTLLQSAFAGPGHHDAEEHSAEEAPEGPHGGRLLQQDDFAVEISIFESGVPPEMRVFSYQAGTAVPPEHVQLQVTLSRLDGEQNVLNFMPEDNYLLGNTTIAEPHSYGVSVSASYQGKTFQWQYDSFEGRVELSDRMIQLSGLKTELATTRLLAQQVHLFGVVAVDPSRQYQVQSPYTAQVQQVLVELGQQVEQGQPLLKLFNTTTLQAFTLTAPANGVITKWQVNPGQVVGSESLLEIVDFSRVFVELSAFPSDLQQLKSGQRVTVFNLHRAQSVQSTLSFIAPAMTDGHIARARAVIDNSNGLWRPGMHVKADILVAEREVAIAVRKSAIQSFRDRPVVFARIGNTFEVRMPEFGIEDDDYIEVLSGLKPGTEYATDNSYLLKADVEKAGASHDH